MRYNLATDGWTDNEVLVIVACFTLWLQNPKNYKKLTLVLTMDLNLKS